MWYLLSLTSPTTVAGSPSQTDLAADRVSAAEEAVGEGLIDDDHHGRLGRIALGEVAAFEHADAEQFEVAGRNGGAMDHHLLIGRGSVSFDVELVPGRGASPGGRRHGDHIGVGHADHARFRLQPLAKHPAEIPLLLGRVARVREIELRHGDIGPVEPRLDAAGVLKAAVEQPGADQRHHGQGHFGDHQQTAQAVRAGTGAAAAAALLEGFIQAGAGGEQGRRRAG